MKSEIRLPLPCICIGRNWPNLEEVSRRFERCAPAVVNKDATAALDGGEREMRVGRRGNQCSVECPSPYGDVR